MPALSKGSVGQKGEKLAVAYLKKHGYKIIQQNFRCKFGEVDIIGYDHGTFCFIEVKTRTTETFGLPELAVTKSKQRQITRVARYYLGRKKIVDKIPCRFDIVAITLGGEKPVVKLIKNAFIL